MNEIGDFLAGIFGPLAMAWLILGFLQQGEELQQSTQALELQAKELNLSVAQQKEMVELTKKQLDLELKELKELKEQRIKQNRAAQPKIV
ncbi:hypothetical protein [Desulfocicer vacuolatum]|uniref:hypothetical protein n=1 Tax=Desulfocicer vacuolatum TaxID=2298 RepID=UPI00111C17C0|nr:hypothetical protein [Desulfocicer vacuolatum]